MIVDCYRGIFSVFCVFLESCITIYGDALYKDVSEINRGVTIILWVARDIRIVEDKGSTPLLQDEKRNQQKAAYPKGKTPPRKGIISVDSVDH